MSGILVNLPLKLCSRMWVWQLHPRYRKFSITRNRWNVEGSVSELQNEQSKENRDLFSNNESFPDTELSQSVTKNGEELILISSCSEDIFHLPTSLTSHPEAPDSQFRIRTPSVTSNDNEMKSFARHQRCLEEPLFIDDIYFQENSLRKSVSKGKSNFVKLEHLHPNSNFVSSDSSTCKESPVGILPVNRDKCNLKHKKYEEQKRTLKSNLEGINEIAVSNTPINKDGRSNLKNKKYGGQKKTLKSNEHHINEDAESNTPVNKDGSNIKRKNFNKMHIEQKKPLKSVIENTNKDAVNMQKNKSFIKDLNSYIRACLETNLIGQAHRTFMYYRCKSLKKARYDITDIEVYDTLLAGWASKGRLNKINALFWHLKEDGFTPSYNAYGALLECLARNNMHKSPEVMRVISEMENNGITLDDIIKKSRFTGDKKSKLMEIVQHVKPDGLVEDKVPNKPYACKLLKKLNVPQKPDSGLTHYSLDKLFSREKLLEMAAAQVDMESAHIVKLKSITVPNNPSEKILYLRKAVENCEEEWSKIIMDQLRNGMKCLWSKVWKQRSMSLFPYLSGVEPRIIANILLEEIRYIAENCEHFSAGVKYLHKNLGIKIMEQHFLSSKQKNKVTNQMLNMYQKYMEYIVQPDCQYLPRELWEHLKSTDCVGPTVDVPDMTWSYHVLVGVGKYLYDILSNIKINSSILNSNSDKVHNVSIFTEKYIPGDKKLSHQIRAHPILCKLYNEARLEYLPFDVSLLPTLCPPRPWIRTDAGGLLLRQTLFIRLPFLAWQQNYAFNKVPSEQLNPCFDSLNMLSQCPWIINKPILDLIIKVFKDNGCEELDVPINPASLPASQKIGSGTSGMEKREKFIMEKKRKEVTSLWYDGLYKLTIANHFRDKVFWFPHNLDFRGRVYPTPPHFNHLGSDLVRSILLFAEGKPLGKNGVNWLKTHLINLTGFKKKESHEERLRYANEILSDILDSADNPFTGKQWWKTSGEPWQTLACCKELANALRSPNPEEYISHFPVHQDGSCNGLQHYAALGRDHLGAKEVNLQPGDAPRDVYSAVAASVEAERERDAKTDCEIAEMLIGLISRKIVKQTVMTFVYGVTKYGAKLQILKRLKEIPGFPKEKCRPASTYLMLKTFASIGEMFTASREIQDWFTECAQCISKISGEPVEWVTPLGLPVIQPYHRMKSMKAATSDIITAGEDFKVSYSSPFEMDQPPNVMKQKNAFAPNFIHSLDSCHMMLTSLFCQREGITFVSVHDCFWTHACTVEIMNIVCREQFVALHSEPILEDLSVFFQKKYGNLKHPKASEKDVLHLQAVLKNVPQKGTFELENVLKSTYFFS